MQIAAGEAYRQASSSPARHLSRRSVCALTGDDVLIISQTDRTPKGYSHVRSNLVRFSESTALSPVAPTIARPNSMSPGFPSAGARNAGRPLYAHRPVLH